MSGAPPSKALTERNSPATTVIINRSSVLVLAALLRLEQPRRALVTGHLRRALEIYDGYTASSIEIAGQQIPLEAEPTAALAYTLSGSEP